MSTTPVHTTVSSLTASYEVLLIDAFGVLVDGTRALPGARELLAHIRASGRRFLVATNDASRLPETASRRFRRLGLPIEPDQIVTAGSLIGPYFASAGLTGARCMVLGPEDSLAYVRAAGGQLVEVRADSACDALVVCDDDGYPFLPTIEEALSALYRHLDAGREVTLVLPNPDLVYPRDAAAWGFTSGAVALLLEAGLARRYPRRGLTFTRLGKPHRPLFDEARRRAGTDRVVMIGDQLETDIAGARGAGMDCALVDTGVTRWQDIARHVSDDLAPTYLLAMPAPESSTP